MSARRATIGSPPAHPIIDERCGSMRCGDLVRRMSSSGSMRYRVGLVIFPGQRASLLLVDGTLLCCWTPSLWLEDRARV